MQDETVDWSVEGMSNIVMVYNTSKKIVYDKLSLLWIEQ